MSAGTALKSVWSVIKWTINSDILGKLSVKKMGLRFLTLALVPLQKKWSSSSRTTASAAAAAAAATLTVCFRK